MSLIPHTTKVEAEIATKLVEAILANGWTISVSDGEAIVQKRSTDRAAILASLSSTDSDTLIVRYRTGLKVGNILLVWGNGEDLISDFTDVPDLSQLINQLTNE